MTMPIPPNRPGGPRACLPAPRRWARALPSALALALLAGCASLGPGQGRPAVDAALAERGLPVAPPADAAAADAEVARLLSAPLDAAGATRIAVLRSPVLRAEYRRLGLAAAEVFEATRPGNPTLALGRRRGDGGVVRSRALGVDLGGLLALPWAQRLGAAEAERARWSVAAAVQAEALGVQRAWWEALRADQAARLEDVRAEAADVAAELASRYHAAGNLAPLELARARAAASEATLAAAHARAEARDTRRALAAAMGLADADGFALPAHLPAPVHHEDDVDALLALAEEANLLRAATRSELRLLGDLERQARRWAWLGGLEAGYERETEADGARLQGPELVIALPLFQQGQARRWRTRAEAGMARDEAEALDLAIAHAVRGGVERVARRRQVLEEMRGTLLPALDAIVAGERQRHDFMLGGVFELIEARRAQLDGYRRWLDALADYGLARLDLARAVGAPLPSEAGPRLVLDEPPGGPPAASAPTARDPHAHHRTQAAEPPSAPEDADAHHHHDHQESPR